MNTKKKIVKKLISTAKEDAEGSVSEEKKDKATGENESTGLTPTKKFPWLGKK